MKIKNLVSAAALSFAAALAPSWAEAHSGNGQGDIYSIDVVDNLEYGGIIPSKDRPATIGDKIVLRVRLVNPDYASGGDAWRFEPLAPIGTLKDNIFLPKFGLKLGENNGEAEYLNAVPVAVPANKFTDVYFRYTVKSGDLALPALLMATTGQAATKGSDYMIYNSNYWELQSTYTPAPGTVNPVSAIWRYRTSWTPPVTAPEPPNGSIDGTGLNMFIRSVDFDKDYAVEAETEGDEGIWRKLYNGMTTTTTKLPTIVPDGKAENSAKLYVWVEDEQYAQPLKSEGAYYVYLLDYDGKPLLDEHGDQKKRYVLPLTLAKDDISRNFHLKGLKQTPDGAVTYVNLGSTPNNIYDGSNVLITNWTSRPIVVVEAPAPYVEITIGDDELPSATVTATDDYKKLATTLNVTLSKESTSDVYVDVSPVLPDCPDVFDEDIIALSLSDQGEPYVMKTTEVHFFPGETRKTLYVYAKGVAENTTTDGITFTPTFTRGTGAEYTGERKSCTLLVAGMKPVIETPAEGSVIEGVSAGEDYPLDVFVRDTYRNKLVDHVYDYRIYYNIGKGWIGKKAGEVINPDDESYDPDTGVFTTSKIKFPAAGDYSVQLQVKNPDGVTSSVVTFRVIVKDALSAWARFDKEKYAEGEEAEVQFFLSQPNPNGDPTYCFLNPQNPDATDKTDSECFTTKGKQAIGCYIAPGKTNSLPNVARVTMRDGGATPVFTVETRKTQSYGAGANPYSPQQISSYVTNIVARVEKVTVGGGSTVSVSGGVLKKDLAATVEKEFKVAVANECRYDLDATGEDVFKTRWIFGGGETRIVEGNPSTVSTKWTPSSASDPNDPVEITVEFQDKDMRKQDDRWSDPFVFYVNVVSAPSISVVSVAGNEVGSITEDSVGTELAEYAVQLNVPPTFQGDGKKLWVDLRVVDSQGNPADEKRIKLSTDHVEFLNNDKYEEFVITEMDGPEKGKDQFRIIATMNAEKSAVDDEGKTWSEGFCKVKILNNDPVIESPADSTDAEGKAIAQVTEVGSQCTLHWSIDDIEADKTNGLKVVWTTSEGQTMTTNAYTGDYIFSFASAGKSKYVTISVSDKDKGTASRTIYYTINPAKKLTTVSTGPTSGLGTTLSQLYARAPGNGEGHTFAEGVAFSGASKHQLNWNCSLLSIVPVYAWGYKVGDIDNGYLDSEKQFQFDIPVTQDGNNDTEAGKKPLESYYEYGDAARDSFLYCWLLHSTAEGAMTTTVAATTPEVKGRTSPWHVTLPEANDGGDSDNISYPDTICEAVFAKELLWSDNMGDINQDGIPDLYVQSYQLSADATAGGDMGGGMSGGMSDGTESAGADLKPITVEKGGNIDEDYLPASLTASYSPLIPGLKGSWVTVGQPFSARLEIRGYHDGLNDAPALALGQDVAERLYAVRDEAGALQYPENATISRVEYEAWLDFAEAKGLDPTNTVNFTKWSPECPSDPTMEDTDDDGMPDGYEYYFWYQAHVGQGEGVNHRYMTGRRYDPKNPGEGKLITSAEIERAMNPRVSNLAVTTDSDNDGLPDLIEMEIGTNPFDFDTDGDGLPDGWEIIVAGTSPYTAFTTPGISDAMRNFDGDAMAFNTPALEASLTVPTNYHVEDPYVFALEDADGDSDGVQWYTTKFKPAITNSETTVTGALVRVDGGSVTNFYMTTAKGYRLTEDNVLMTELLKTETWQVVPVEDLTNDLPSVADAPYRYVRLAPTALKPGTRFLEPPAKNPDEFEAFGFLTLAESAPELDCNAAWFYGSSAVSTMTTGQDTANMGGFGMLALGRYQGAPAGVPLTARPRAYSNLAYLHYLVYQEWGFDPRTAWNANTPLAPRWAKKKTTGVGDSQTSETYDNISSGSWAGAANRTREFTTYDEFLLYSFWINNGCATPSFATRYDDVLALVNEWLAQTTNPQGPNEPDLDTDGEEVGEDEMIPYHGRNSDNGADTDMDGVPDGWELYVMTGPKYNLMGMKLCYVFAGPNGSAPNANRALFPFVSGDSAFGHMSPLVAEAASTKTDNETVSGDEDDLTELQEYAGTDSCAYYSKAAEGATPFSTTIVRPAEHAKWFNKFFPTDPWAKDTDHDGVTDYGEFEGGRAMVKSHSFVYGEPADDGSQCIVGGGLNPCSVDTDLDGLPDGWESQYPGQEIYSESYAIAHNLIDADGKPIIDYGLPEGAEGGRGNPLQGLVDGMDGTVKDAFNTPYKNYATANGDSTYSASKIISVNGARQVVDRDYDHDGLSNWQEYLTGAMRCWRYDDPFSPWHYVPNEDWFVVEGETNEFSLAKAMAAVGTDDPGEFWYKALVDKSSPYYAPRLQTGTSAMSQYFTWLDPRKYGFDPAYSDTGSYYIFFSRIGDDNLADWWGGEGGLDIKGDFPKEPSRYISTSPIEADSDHDGMDDYYELFHGMNPLLGEPGVSYESDGPCDLVFDAWKDTGTNKAFHDAEDNYWSRDPETLLGKTPRCVLDGNMYDFELFPWLNGAANADPDGDDIRNQQESIMPMVAPTTIWYHTDPTPLWMTDTSYTNSLVTRFFRVAITPNASSLGGESFTYNGETYYFCELTGGYYIDPMEGPKLKPYTPDRWSLTGSADKKNWIFSFEENEGYDSDHDAIGDYEELQGKFTSATDPKDFDSPHRRQAMYFPGQDAALQSMPYESEKHPLGHTGYPDDMSFVQYTVECWVYPERDTDQTILERAIWSTYSNPGDQEYLRRNFQLAIKQGRWYTMFDPNGTLSNKQVQVISSAPIALNKWTHLAATYDTKKLTLYVNGVPEPSQPANLTPEYGSSAVTVYPGDPQSMKAELNNAKGNMYWFDREYQYIALLMGASFKGVGDKVTSPTHLNVMNGKGWNRYKSFFQGYVDEVRIWDGARTEEQIRDNMKVRFTAETAKANRDDFYDQWAAGNRRYMKNDAGNDYNPIPELRYHFSFDSIPGAANPAMVAKVPFGFGDEGPKAPLSRPEGYEIPWWKTVLNGYTGTVYGYPAWIQWIPNTVTHLPRFDTTTLDSMYWSEDFAGNEEGSYKFARTAEPVSMWKQMVRNKITKDDDFYSTDRRYWQVYTSGTNRESNLTKIFEFTGRHLNQMGDDLLPLGGAFVKYADVMWDEQGPSSNWEISGGDADNDGLPDWWSEYAKDNYRRDDMDPGAEITWDTIVNYHGRLITAGEAYRLDLAKGFYVNEYGEIETDPEQAAKRQQTADEDGDGMTDWWEDQHGLQTWSKTDAEADPDNDGLNNYSEYLVAQGAAPYGFTNLNPKAARSFVGQLVSDYFLSVPDEVADEKHISRNEYLGEVFTDHDFMEEWWENKYSLSYANSRVYDPWDDTDGDGWSNFCECRAALWGGIFAADLIDRYLDGDDRNHVACYPQPAIGLRINYEKDQINDVVGRRLVVRTSTGGKRMDSTFFVIGANERDPNGNPGIVSESHFVGGYFEDTVLRGFLNPGNIVPVGVTVRRASLSSEDDLWWNYNWYSEHWGAMLAYHATPPYGYGSFEEYREQLRRYPHIELEEGSVSWEAFGVVFSDAEGHYGTIKDGTTEIGTIDFRTGEYALDLSKIRVQGDPPSSYVFAFDYQYRIGENWPQTLWLSETAMSSGLHETAPLLGGCVKEGLNTIEAFIDLDNNMVYDIGEPYGCVKNVPVGWHKVPVVTIELTDQSVQFQRAALVVAEQGAASGVGENQAQEVTVQIMRDAINGKSAGCPLLVKKFIPEDRGYITEADIISERMPELDWGWLPRNAIEVQYSIIESVPLADGSVSNVILSTFTKLFNPSNRPAVSAVSPIANEPVYSAAPTFRFMMENTASAFAIQVGREGASGKTNVIYDSGVQLRGGREPVAVGKSAYAFTAPIYANTSVTTNGAPVLLDGSNYFWRVASFNAKFSSAKDADYSAWTPFQMDVANVNRYPRQATGYGSVAAAVRYFGPARTNDLTNLIIVEAFENADFTGQALAQTRVGSTNDLDNVNLRSDTLEVTNACLIGVLPGTVYLRAYIDLNNNGKWDKFEPWGYANNVGRYGEAFSHAPIYNPLGIEVSRGIGDVVKPNVAAIFIEDTDYDKNEIPDCLQKWDDSIGDPDSDNDGLTDYEEENVYGSNPYDAYSIWLRNKGDESAKYTDGEAIRFNLLDGNVGTDSDFDGLTNWQELLACRKDKKLGLKVDDPMSDGLTNDYFRVFKSGVEYTGELNGAEWIEYDARMFFGMNNLSRAGTRDLLNEGWDMWSISRYILNGGQIVQWNAIGEGGATTNANEISYEPIPELKVTLLYRGGGSKDVRFAAYQGPLMDLENTFPATEWKSAVGFDNGVGKLTLSISNRVEETGTLKQGPARIVAYIDNDGDGKFSCADSFGMAETEIGWANHELEIRLGDPCGALPAFEFGDGSNFISQVKIVRTQVNGKPVLNPHTVYKRVYANNIQRATLFPDDYVLSGTGKDGEGKTYIGLDRYLANYKNVDSATYEVLVGQGPFTVSNLIEYATIVTNKDSAGKLHYSTNYVSTGAVNPTFTVNYSRIRDIAQVIVTPDQLKSTATVQFTVPTDTPATKFWLRISGGTFLPGGKTYPDELGGTTIGDKTYTSESGFLMPAAAQGLATIRLSDYVNKLDLQPGVEYTVEIALGNDRFGKPATGTDWSKPATFKVNSDPAWNGQIAVDVRYRHLIEEVAAWKSNQVVIAAYTTPDLVNPVVTTSGDKPTLTGLLAGEKYYVAAWYVKDAEDGRDNAKTVRQPYDTWGYATLQGQYPLCFNAAPITASLKDAAPVNTVVVYMQDTDWNGNFKKDRLESFKAKNGFTDLGGGTINYADDFDLDGLPDAWEEAQEEEGPTEEKQFSDEAMACYEVPDMLYVAIGKDGGESNWVWCAVLDGFDPTSGHRLTDGTIEKQTPASELDCLYLSYPYTYSYAVAPKYWDGIGTNVHFSAEYKVQDVRIGKAKFVHAQVYALFGYNPKTANSTVPTNEWTAVHSKPFTANDKYRVCRYLQNIGVEGVDESMMLTNMAYQWIWTLKDKVIDSDRDGIADGWELYTMFGPNYSLKTGAGAYNADSMKGAVDAGIISPFTTEDGQADAPGEGSKLKLVEEYDNGHIPTDPWNLYTFDDRYTIDGVEYVISDKEAFDYHLKHFEGEEGDKYQDFDYDGLCNYDEYVITMNRAETLDPDKLSTYEDGMPVATKGRSFMALPGGQKDPDYFLKSLQKNAKAEAAGYGVFFDYLGFDYTSHDFLESWWKDQFTAILPTGEKYVNRVRFEPYDDPDNDGWSNWSERQSGTNPSKDATLSLSNASGEDNTVPEYPIPRVSLTAIYDDGGSHTADIVVKAWNGSSTAAIPDAIWKVAGSGGTASEVTRFIGINPRKPKTIILGPGEIAQQSMKLWFFDPLSYDEHVTKEGREYTYYDIDTSTWHHPIGLTDTPDATDVTKGVFAGGVVDYVNGVVTVDFSQFLDRDYRLLSGQSSPDDYTITHLDLFMSYVKVTYRSRLVGAGNVQKFVLGTAEPASDASRGHLRQGLNTFVVFADLNRNGEYDPGEPFGMKENVQVGFEGTQVAVSLSSTSPVIPRFNPLAIDDSASEEDETAAGAEETKAEGAEGTKAEGAEGTKAASGAVTVTYKGKPVISDLGEYATIRIVRWELNGQPCTHRTVFRKTAENLGVITEADILSAQNFDLDWNYLEADAAKAGIGLEEIDTITYAVFVDGKVLSTVSEENVTGWIFKRFSTLRDKATPVAPSAGKTTIVNSTRPAFEFKAPQGYPAFAFELLDANGDVVFESTELITTRNAVGNVEYCPPVYFGWDPADLEHGLLPNGDYTWRVALLSAKFRHANKDDWSEAGAFTVELAQGVVHDTDKGMLDVTVRYYGDAPVDADHPIIVRAFKTPDFTGVPEGQAVITDVTLLNSHTDITTVNAKMFGLEPGDYYVCAFVDTKKDGKRMRWESWGYQNNVGLRMRNLYTPVAARVVRNITTTSLVYIEDMDCNNDDIPDWIDPSVLDGTWPWPWPEPEEPVVPPTPVVPVNPEELDPENPGGDLPPWYPEVEPSDDDVMAYEDVENVQLVRIGLNDADPAARWYAVMDLSEEGTKLRDSDIPLQTLAKDIDSLVTTWEMGRFTGVGTAIRFKGDEKVLETRSATVRLIHAQVYAKNGFNPLTANALAYQSGTAVNTKRFTAADKFYVCRYLENIGVAGISEEAMLKDVEKALKGVDPVDWESVARPIWSKYTLAPDEIDSDRDDIADGWELYTMFGVRGLKTFMEAARGDLAAAKISPFNTADGMMLAPAWLDANGDPLIEDAKGNPIALKLVEEFDGGYLPTDPWATDTDRDGVLDCYAYNYMLKGDDGHKDYDGDGLSNYAEYLVSEVFKSMKLDPRKAKTNGDCLDYFRKAGDLYIGEIVTDHDQVNDQWEESYRSAANAYVYDPNRDDDLDGWSNYAECRAGTDPSKTTKLGVSGYTKNEYPIPVIEAKVAYNGRDINLGALVFKAWNEKDDPDMTSAPDAIWTLGNGEAKDETDTSAGASSSETASTAEEEEMYIGRRPDGIQRYHLKGGSICRGSVEVSFLDQSYSRTNIGTNESDGAMWYVGVKDRDGTLVDLRNGGAVGTVDYDTGVLTLDCSKFVGTVTVSTTVKAFGDMERGGGNYDTITLDDAYLRLNWQAKFVGLSPSGVHYLGVADKVGETAKSHGHVREGKTTFVCFVDEDGDGSYSAGEPLGVVRGVDVGWQGAKFDIELTEMSAITPRIALWDDESDREMTVDGFVNGFDMGAYKHSYEASWYYPSTNEEESISMYLTAMANRVDTTRRPDDGKQTRIRVVRYGIDNFFAYQCGVYSSGLGKGFDQRVVLDRTFDQDGRDFLCEADFLGADQFDIDWDLMQADGIVGENGNPLGGVKSAACNVSNMTYLVVIGDGKKDFRGANDTNTVRALSTLVTRRFEVTRSVPVARSLNYVFSARPTFTWSMPNEDKWASAFGSTYTAFKIEVSGKDGVIYDSGIQRAPKQNADGSFTWTADLYAGSKTKTGADFLPAGNYTWRVTMYNAKFRSDAWSNDAGFSMSVNTRQDVNDNGYSLVNVAVKYAGPSKVLEKVENLTDPKGKLYIEAFETADFSGLPVASVYCDDKASITDISKLVANARLIGLPTEGTYYIRAYIDSNGNRVKDDWESWGYAKEPVSFAGRVTAPEVGLFIEDADTDNDCIPDAFEYANAGWEDDFADIQDVITSSVAEDGKILLLEEFFENLTPANISTGLGGATLTFFQNSEWAKNFLYGALGTKSATIEEIRDMIKEQSAVNQVRITAFSMDTANRKAYIYVDGEVETTTAGMAMMTVYDLPAPDQLTVKVIVYGKDSLMDTTWEKIGEVNATLGKNEKLIEVDLRDLSNGSIGPKGFYKVEIEKVEE